MGNFVYIYYIKQKEMAKFGILIGDTHITYTNVTSAEQLIPTFIRRVIEDMDRITIPKGGLKEAMQTFVNEYGEVLLENTYNDTGKRESTIVCMEDAADHINNQGWITCNRSSVNNTDVYNMIVAYMRKKEIQDYEWKEKEVA